MALASRTLPNSAEAYLASTSAAAGALMMPSGIWRKHLSSAKSENLERAFGRLRSIAPLMMNQRCSSGRLLPVRARAIIPDGSAKSTQRGALQAARSFLATLALDYNPDGATWTRLTSRFTAGYRGRARILAAWKEELVGGTDRPVPVVLGGPHHGPWRSAKMRSF
jgi:hypothetical protein